MDSVETEDGTGDDMVAKGLDFDGVFLSILEIDELGLGWNWKLNNFGLVNGASRTEIGAWIDVREDFTATSMAASLRAQAREREEQGCSEVQVFEGNLLCKVYLVIQLDI